MSMTRRNVLQGAAALVAGSALPAWAQQGGEVFRILGSNIVRNTLMRESGDGIADIWAAANKRKIELIAAPTVNLHERFFREASLSNTTIHLGTIVNRYATSRTANLLHPLDDLMKKDPIEEWDDFAPQLRRAMTFGGKLYGIPFFSVVGGLHYNEELMAERGLKGPPRTMEQVVEYAKKLTFQRSNGTQVIGLSFDGARPTQLIDFIRAYGGEFVTPDFKVHVNRPETIRAITVLAELFKAGALPKGMFTWSVDGAVTHMQQGFGAMSMSLFTFSNQYNAPGRSKHAGKIKATAIPMAAEAKSTAKLINPRNEVWCYVIPKNAPDKERTWSFIRHVSNKENTMRWSLEFPSPARLSVFKNPEIRKRIHFAEDLGRVMPNSILMTNWDNYARAEDLFKDAVESVFLGRTTPKAAMDAVAKGLVPLLPKDRKG